VVTGSQILVFLSTETWTPSCEADHLHPNNAEMSNAWNFISMYCTHILGLIVLVRQREEFTIALFI
jgi:hypothetical protein